MRIACAGYRTWALNIYDRLASTTDHAFLIFRSKSQFDKNILDDFKPDLVLFYGWSWFVPDEILAAHTCLMLHPSPLPRYRGGSPIQNQIIAGETCSKVSIFVMTNELDAGDLVGQTDFSLVGTIDEIFNRIEEEGFKLTLRIFEDGMHPTEQNHSDATYFSRRTPDQSEITIEEITTCSAEYLYNKIRMLADPYPNAYILTSDGKKLFITDSRVDDTI